MRTAVLSDVHANLPALKAVLTDIFSLGVDRIISLGDLVGYGPQPAEVLELAYAHVDHFVMGNHDAVIAQCMDPAQFNDAARAMVEWTARQLDGKAAAFLARQPFVLTGPTFRCSHGSPACPPRFAYVLEPADAQAAWEAAPEQFLFVGHSHVPGLFVRGHSGTPHWLEPQDFAAEPHKRYIVNAGSVGQPRAADVRASYCLFDDGLDQVLFRQVPFDLEAYRAAVERAAPPLRTAHFLTVAENGRPQPLREVLDFHPPTQEAVRDQAVTVAHVGRALRSARRWRLGAAGLLVLLVTAVAAAVGLYRRGRPAGVELAALSAAPLEAPACGEGSLPAPGPAGPVTRAARLQDWTVRLTDASRQSLTVDDETKDGTPVRVFHLHSSAALPLALVSRPVQTSAGMRFQAQASCRAASPVQGYAEICLVLRDRAGIEKPLLHCPLDSLSGERWRSYRRSLPPEGLQQDGELHWVLRGEFSGELLVREADLQRTR